MRYGRGLAAFLGLASQAQAQRFGFTHQMLPADADFTRGVALGDVDGDGDLDVFVANSPGQNRLYQNDGTGFFTDVTATNLPVLVGNSQAVALGDVDGDGDLDAFVGNNGQDRLYLNDGTGVFTDVTAASLPALVDDTRSVALGDVDGDGDLDAFLAVIGGQNRLYRNGGTGAFSDVTAGSLPALVSSAQAVALGDVDGDGDLDAFVGANNVFPGGQTSLYLNGGTGVFTDVTATNLPFVGNTTTAVALGDVDGDGDLDAVLGNSPSCPAPFCGGLQDRLYLNGGTGVFTDATATNLPVLLGFTQAVALGDVDGDGDLDAFIGISGGPNRLYLNAGAGVFTDFTVTNLPAVNNQTLAVALGDVDGDGDLDAVVGNLAGQDLLHLNDGTGAFTDATATNLPALPAFTEAVAFGDVDGDGDLDAFLGNNGPERLFLNGGTGAFADVTAANLPGLVDDTKAVALGDVDGDGDLDAIAGNAQQDRLYLNGGTGVFTDVTATNLPAILDNAQAVALGDVDGDGDLDAFIGNVRSISSGPNRLYLNGGTGAFTLAPATNLPALVDNTHAVALGDVNGDGDLDLFLGTEGSLPGGGQNRLYLNGGTGVFTDVTGTNLPALLDNTRAVALGDVDGDGDVDAFAGNIGPDRLHLNGGTGVFTDVTGTNLPTPFDSTQAWALGDVDGDGDLDAFVGNGFSPAGSGQNRLYLNGGTGVFTDMTAASLPAIVDDTRAVALGDVDGDGDLDAFVGNFGQSRLAINLTRQVAWRGTPRVGKPLTLDIRGPANGTWVLGVSLASASLPIPPLGTLRLDPATLFVVAGGSFDPQGRASLPLLVPPNPALVGGSFFWQAVVGPPPLLTNLEVTTLTDL